MKYVTSIIVFIIGLNSAQANDLIYKSGFENNALVSGTAAGINNIGLSLQLTVNANTETLAIDSNGQFVFFMPVTAGDNWWVSVIQLPSNPQQQNCNASNTSGVMPANGTDSLLVTCNDSPWNWDQMNWNEGGWN